MCTGAESAGYGAGGGRRGVADESRPPVGAWPTLVCIRAHDRKLRQLVQLNKDRRGAHWPAAPGKLSAMWRR